MTGLTGFHQAHAVSWKKTRVQAPLVSVVRKLILDPLKDLDSKKEITLPSVSRMHAKARRKNKLSFEKEPPLTGGFFYAGSLLHPIFE